MKCRASTATTVTIGPFVDASDGVTPLTALTITPSDVRLSKNGGAFANKNESSNCTHLESGYYACQLDATDTNTAGRLRIAVTMSGALPVWLDLDVLPAAIYDSLIAGTAALDVDLTADAVDDIWDEPLTGATHNVATSAGRRLRALDVTPIITVYYVDANSGNDSSAGDTPDAPFATIGKALSVVSSGETIMVAPGTYSESNLDVSVDAIHLVMDDGVFIDSGGASPCLTISGNYCHIIGGVMYPTVAAVGVSIAAGVELTRVENVCTRNCTISFDVGGVGSWLLDCRSTLHTQTGFQITGTYNRLERCKAVGNGANTRGFYLSSAGADYNQLLNCTSTGNLTAPFETVSGADGNTISHCTAGGGDGDYVDNGSNNGWPNFATDPALKQNDILSDATPFPGDRIDAYISSRASESSLTSVYTSLSNLIVGVSNKLGAFTGSGINTVLGFLQALMRKDASAPSDLGGTYDPTTDSNEALAEQISVIDPGGAYVVTRRIIDSNGDAVANMKVTVQGDDGGDADGTRIAVGTTSSTGYITFNLDAGTYHILTPSTIAYTASNTTVTVSDNSTDTIIITARAIPDPPSGDYCTVIAYNSSVANNKASGVLKVIKVHSPRTTGSGNTKVSVVWNDDDEAEFDSDGIASLYLLRGAVVDLEAQLVGAANITKRRLVVPDADSANWENMEEA